MFARQRKILLVGDSIAGRGFALNEFTNQLNPHSALYYLNVPDHVINQVFFENNVACRAETYEFGAATDAGLPAALELYVASNLGRGDCVVIEDAGFHVDSTAEYQAALESLITACKQPGVTVFVMTMFEYSPGLGPDYEWDTDIDGRTINDAILAAAASAGATVIDMNAAMDFLRIEALFHNGLAVMLADGIHPNVWGSMYMAGVILEATGWRDKIVTYQSLIDLAAADVGGVLDYGAGGWTAAKRAAYCSLILGSNRKHLVGAAGFDGSLDWLTRGANLTGVVDGKQGTLSFWVDFTGGDGVVQGIVDTTSNRFRVLKNSSNFIAIQGTSAAAALVLQLVSDIAVLAASGWVHVLASWNLATGAAHMYLNNVEALAAAPAPTLVNTDIDYTTGDWLIGSFTAGSLLSAELSEFWFVPVYTDLSVAANRAKFIDANGKPANVAGPALNGEGPGVQPAIYLSGYADSWHTNKGNGGGMTENGALGYAGGSPSDS